MEAESRESESGSPHVAGDDRPVSNGGGRDGVVPGVPVPVRVRAGLAGGRAVRAALLSHAAKHGACARGQGRVGAAGAPCQRAQAARARTWRCVFVLAQRLLARSPFVPLNTLPLTGSFDDATEVCCAAPRACVCMGTQRVLCAQAAVRRYQAGHGLPVDGVFRAEDGQQLLDVHTCDGSV